MRRFGSLLASFVLLGSLAGSSLAANPAPKSSFTGDFDLYDRDGTLLGHATAQLFEPTDKRLVPGSYDFKAAPGRWLRESHAQIAGTAFWYDPNHEPIGATVLGATVAFGWGVECVYLGPNDAFCQDFAVMFIDDVDPSVPNEAAFADSKLANGDWDFQSWQVVGKGDFVVKFAGS